MIVRRSIEKINQEIIDQMSSLGVFGGPYGCYGSVEKTLGGVRRYRNSRQIFAVDGPLAHDVTPRGYYVDDKHEREYCATYMIRPVIVGGSVYQSLPDEGTGGILSEMIVISPRRGAVSRHFAWLNCGWLRTVELDLSPGQIARNIMDDIADGQTCITGAYDRG